MLIVAVTVWYYKLNVHTSIAAEYGLYVAAVGAIFAALCSVWAVADALIAGRSSR